MKKNILWMRREEKKKDVTRGTAWNGRLPTWQRHLATPGKPTNRLNLGESESNGVTHNPILLVDRLQTEQPAMDEPLTVLPEFLWANGQLIKKKKRKNPTGWIREGRRPEVTQMKNLQRQKVEPVVCVKNQGQERNGGTHDWVRNHIKYLE